MLTKTLRISVVATVIAGALFASEVVGGAPAGTAHLPDLQTAPPSDLRISRSGGTRLLRFSNTVWNAGSGPLELRPLNSGGATQAYQRIYSHNDQGVWYLFSEVMIGTFTFHVAHNHWHFDDFAVYQIRNVNPDGSMGSLIKRAGTKQTFCIADTTQINASLEHSAPLTYPVSNCDQNNVQGLSVGWGDRYGYNLAGQSIDVTGLPDGLYYLYSVADRDNRIQETNNANNGAAVKIRIRKHTVRIVG